MQTVFRRALLYALIPVTSVGAQSLVPDPFEIGPVVVSGQLDQSYQLRSSGDETDQDLFGFLGLDAVYQSREPRAVRDFRELGFHLQGSYNLDIDSSEAEESSTTTGSGIFAGLSDTFGDRLHAYLHSAFLEAKNVATFERVRLGRQTLYREEGFLFDGMFARTRRVAATALEIFGGLPTRLYESSASGDALFGVGLNSEPLAGLHLGADYVFARDRREDAPDSQDHLYLLHGRYRIDEEWSLRGSTSWEGSRDRRQLLEVHYLGSEWGLSASLRAIRQNGIVEFHSDELSPYVLVQGAYAPYYEYALDLHQPLGEHFGIGGGMHLRHLQDSSDAGIFNHSFRNYFLSIDSQDLWSGGRASLRGDAWDAEGEDIWTAGFELEQRVAEIVRARVGTSYSLYRFDPFTGTERNRDRVYYLKLRWHLSPRFDLDTDYQYEKDSADEYHRLTIRLRAQI